MIPDRVEHAAVDLALGLGVRGAGRSVPQRGGPGVLAAHLASSSGGASRSASCSQTARSQRFRSESGTPICSAQPAASSATRWMCSSRAGVTTAHSGSVGRSPGGVGARRRHRYRSFTPIPSPSLMLSMRRVPPIRAASRRRRSGHPPFSTGASRLGIHDGNILDRHRRLPPRAPAACRPPAPRAGSRRRARRGAPPAARGSAPGPLPILGAEISVPAAQREPIRLPHRSDHRRSRPASRDPRTIRRIRVSCWMSFWPKTGQIRLHQVKQLGDDGQHAGEVAWPGRALPPLGDRSGIDSDFRVRRIHG